MAGGGFIRSSKKTFLIVSHDRYFLDRVTTKTLELEHTRAAVFSGPYSVFKRKKQEQRDAQMKHYLQQQKEIKRIEDFVANQRRWNRERNIIAAESRLRGPYGQARKAEGGGQSAVLAFQTAASKAATCFRCAASAKRPAAPLLTDVAFELKLGDRLFIVGANGSGQVHADRNSHLPGWSPTAAGTNTATTRSSAITIRSSSSSTTKIPSSASCGTKTAR